MLSRDVEKTEEFLSFVKDIYKNQQFADFLKLCIDHDMLANVTDEDLSWCYENKELALPLFNNNGISISADVGSDGTVRIGIDPSSCFNKTSSCSIVANLPLKSKRELASFYKLLEQIFDKKSNTSKDWFRRASICWFGSYATFG